MAKKFTEVERGTFQKVGKEYDYIVEVGEDFNGKKDARIRIIEERPIIRKLRTRYDPEIELFGDKNASMNVSLGYNIKNIDSTIKWLKHAFLLPIYGIGFTALFYYSFKLPSSSIPGSYLGLSFLIIGLSSIILILASFSPLKSSPISTI